MSTLDGRRDKLSLRVWIVQNGEEIPSDPGPPRLLRQCILAEQLVARGHHVTYWAPSFNHQRKIQRTAPAVHTTGSAFQVRLLTSRSYSSNVSAARIRSHRDAARQFRVQAEALPRPDVVIAGYPTIELAHASIAFASQQGIPSVVDFRDQWPDIIVQQLGGARIFGSPLIRHWRRLQSEIVLSATSVCGITDEFVDWALTRGPRVRGGLDLAFPLAPPVARTPEAEVSAAQQFVRTQLGAKPSEAVWAVFAGGMGGRSDIRTVVEAAGRLPEDHRFRLIMAGAGDLAGEIEAAANASNNVSFIGWRSAAEVAALLELGDVGVLPYPNSSDFLMSFPNKVGEYLSHGLPVLSGLGGVTGTMLRSHGLLEQYREGDVDDCVRALSAIVERGPEPQRVQAARDLFAEQFNPDVIYPAYARHVEAVASRGLAHHTKGWT